MSRHILNWLAFHTTKVGMAGRVFGMRGPQCAWVAFGRVLDMRACGGSRDSQALSKAESLH